MESGRKAVRLCLLFVSCLSIRAGSLPASEPASVRPDPGDLVSFRGRNGETFRFSITGTSAGSVWGSDVYTDDSRLSKAAVHAGRLEVGQASEVSVMILPGRSSYEGSRRNGIATSSYKTWHGSFAFTDDPGSREESGEEAMLSPVPDEPPAGSPRTEVPSDRSRPRPWFPGCSRKKPERVPVDGDQEVLQERETDGAGRTVERDRKSADLRVGSAPGDGDHLPEDESVPGVRIPLGINIGIDPDFGPYFLFVRPFTMDKTEVPKWHWDDVYAWAVENGYQFSGPPAQGATVRSASGEGERTYQYGEVDSMVADKLKNRSLGKNYWYRPEPQPEDRSSRPYPVHYVTWYDTLKWCNARSEKEGRVPAYTVNGTPYRAGNHTPDCDFSANGYRLPTSVEWEYAARGKLSSRRFPWGNRIDHSKANYFSSEAFSYDVSSTRGAHPFYRTEYDSWLLGKGSSALLSPVGRFPPNGFGLHDMAGNVWEWVWDVDAEHLPALRFAAGRLSVTPTSREVPPGAFSAARGGGAAAEADKCRVGLRLGGHPERPVVNVGFRTVISGWN